MEDQNVKVLSRRIAEEIFLSAPYILKGENDSVKDTVIYMGWLCDSEDGVNVVEKMEPIINKHIARLLLLYN